MNLYEYDEELISVIVPVYNTGEFLENCLESISGQTYGNIEIILIDDGSTDNSSKICDDFSRKDSRFKVIHKSNGGVSSARNTGLDNVRGKYIAWVDSDDWVDSDYLEILYHYLSINKADMVVGDYANGDRLQQNWQPRIKECCLSGKQAFSFFLRQRIEPGVCGGLYKTELFQGIRFQGRIAEDEEANFQILKKENVSLTRLINFKRYHYRVRSESITHKEVEVWKEAMEHAISIRERVIHLGRRYILDVNYKVLYVAVILYELADGPLKQDAQETIVKICFRQHFFSSSIDEKKNMLKGIAIAYKGSLRCWNRLSQ